MPNPDGPVCTCVTRVVQTKYGPATIIQVIDPFCQRKIHAAAGTYTGPRAAYEPAGNGGDVG